MRLCEQCEKEIPEARIRIQPEAILCVPCKQEDDDFKWKMKHIGRDDSPTIARNKEDWNKIKKQKKLGNI